MNIFPVQNLTKMDTIKQYKLQQSKIHLQLESMAFQKILHFLFFIRIFITLYFKVLSNERFKAIFRKHSRDTIDHGTIV